MDGSLETIINLYQFPTGRRLFAHKQIRARAESDGFDKLVKHCDKAITHDTQTQSLEKRWAGESITSDTNPEAQRLDVLVDRTLGAIRDHALAQAAGAPDNDPIHITVDNFVKKVFPAGVHAITSLPYVEELEAVQAIVHSLQNELAPLVQELNLQRHVTRLNTLAIDYRKALEAPPPSVLTWGNVRNARAEGQGLLLETVAIIVGKYHSRSAKGTAERLHLLEPILRQNDSLGAAFKNRRAPSDINADTGDEIANAPAAPTNPSTP
jgi:hypothetical protein